MNSRPFLVPFLLPALVLAGSAKLGAQAPPSQPGTFGWIAKVDLEFGGDEVAKVYFKDNSTQSVNAGQGVTLGGGGHYRPAGSMFDFSGTIGYKFVSTKATNKEISLSRMVLELRADYFLSPTLWIGAGPVWHRSIRLDTDGLANNLSFQDASGVTAKFGWKFAALSYTSMKYQDEFGLGYSADCFGVELIARF